MYDCSIFFREMFIGFIFIQFLSRCLYRTLLSMINENMSIEQIIWEPYSYWRGKDVLVFFNLNLLLQFQVNVIITALCIRHFYKLNITMYLRSLILCSSGFFVNCVLLQLYYFLQNTYFLQFHMMVINQLITVQLL